MVVAGLTVWWAMATSREISMITEIEDQVTSRIELAKTLAQIMLGVLVFGTLWATWRRAKAAERTVEVSQESQITERFTRAVGQLGDRDSMAIRLGGIYALERIAKDSDKDHWQVMEVLTAYVRQYAPSDETPDSPQQFKPIGTDIQAILTVLGRRNAKHEKPGQRLNLRITDLRAAELEEADLRKVDFRFCNLQNVYLKDAKLEGANLFHANLMHTVLDGADLRGANLVVVWNLTQEQVDSAISDETTELPDYLSRGHNQ